LKTGLFNWRLNNQIRAPEVRVIGADGKQLGILKINEALSKAHEEGLDLVEIAPNAKPPVTKIVELGKFRYQEEKRLQKLKKKGKIFTFYCKSRLPNEAGESKSVFRRKQQS